METAQISDAVASSVTLGLIMHFITDITTLTYMLSIMYYFVSLLYRSLVSALQLCY